MTDSNPLISLIIVSYNSRYKELKKVLHELKFQTYKNIEIIIVGNNITNNMNSFLNSWKNENKLNKYINFNENVSDYLDHSKIGRLRYQKGVDISNGELIYFQSDDDLLSYDYFERIVRLFNLNSECVSAIGNTSGEYYWKENKFVEPLINKNFNKIRFLDGKKAIFNFFYKKPYHNPNPGFCYVFKKSLLNKVGDKIWYGYDFSILLSIVSQGVTGTDPKASMYWGRHSSKMSLGLNIYNNKFLIYNDQFKVRNETALKIWKSKGFTNKECSKLMHFLKRELAKHSVYGLIYSIKNLKISLFFSHLKIIVTNDILIIFILFPELFNFAIMKLKNK